ncbi:glycosyltransferase family 4 protein [Leptolyngbya sp. GB1-A1]|uniref:glycosyltransferase family 4 protein n=1 Tax=unclassified Leptolyngbya TaxID=2650499 RepID=UPI0019A35C9C|nr:glycosyltransferase [Cyanobacteria bacterium FACHB-502]
MASSHPLRILMLSSTFPYPPSRGGTEVRTFHLLKSLAKQHSVTVATQRHGDVSDADVDALRSHLSDLVVFPLPQEPKGVSLPAKLLGRVARFGQAWMRQTPPNVLHRYSPELQAWVDRAVASKQFDVITCEHSVNEIYIRPEFRHQIRTIVDVHSSVYAWTRHHLETQAAVHPLRDRFYLPLLRRYEYRYCRKFSQIVVTTDDDRQEFLDLGATAPIQVIPNGVDLVQFPLRSSDPGGRTLIFVGAMDASHNIDAVRFFAIEILPQLQQRYPDAVFRIVGARPVPAVQELAARPGVIVTGPVESMVKELHQATVCVVSLRTGFGIKNKTLEAMAAGVPVIGSDRGLEGLAVDGTVPLRAIRANQIDEYLHAIGRLFEDASLRQQLSQAARSMVEQEFTWEQAGTRYEQALKGV